MHHRAGFLAAQTYAPAGQFWLAAKHHEGPQKAPRPRFLAAHYKRLGLGAQTSVRLTPWCKATDKSYQHQQIGTTIHWKFMQQGFHAVPQRNSSLAAGQPVYNIIVHCLNIVYSLRKAIWSQLLPEGTWSLAR